jgi:hypothetical protein
MTLSKEFRATSDSGGQKGRKLEAFGLLPYSSLAEVAKVYNYGAQKYSPHNWRKGYPWSWSFDAMQRHLAAWWEGEDQDQESGLNHLAHAAFHVLALLWFQKHAVGKDDRYVVGEDKAGQEVPASDTVGNKEHMARAGHMADLPLSPKELEFYKKAFGLTPGRGGLVLSPEEEDKCQTTK